MLLGSDCIVAEVDPEITFAQGPCLPRGSLSDLIECGRNRKVDLSLETWGFPVS